VLVLSVDDRHARGSALLQDCSGTIVIDVSHALLLPQEFADGLEVVAKPTTRRPTTVTA